MHGFLFYFLLRDNAHTIRTGNKRTCNLEFKMFPCAREIARYAISELSS